MKIKKIPSTKNQIPSPDYFIFHIVGDFYLGFRGFPNTRKAMAGARNG